MNLFTGSLRRPDRHDSDVLQLAARVGEADVDVFDVFIGDCFHESLLLRSEVPLFYQLECLDLRSSPVFAGADADRLFD